MRNRLIFAIVLSILQRLVSSTWGGTRGGGGTNYVWRSNGTVSVSSTSTHSQNLNSDVTCSYYGGHAASCRNNGCFYCCSNENCYSNETIASSCLSGCSQHCENTLDCNTNGCVYEYRSQKCVRKNFNGRIVFSINFCGKDFTDSNGVWYQRQTDSADCVNCFAIRGKCVKYNHRLTSKDAELYKDNMEISYIQMEIPVLQDGNYRFTFKFYGKSNMPMRGTLNAHEIFNNLIFATGRAESHELKINFKISMNVTVLTMSHGSGSYIIMDRKLHLQLTGEPPQPEDIRLSPVISALYLEKINLHNFLPFSRFSKRLDKV